MSTKRDLLSKSMPLINLSGLTKSAALVLAVAIYVLLPSFTRPTCRAAEIQVARFTKADLATANGSARIGIQGANMACILTSIEARVQLNPDHWDSDAEATNWTTWLTAFDDNLIAKWFKNAPLNGQETVGIRINPDSSVNITNNTFFAGADVATADAQSSFETAIATSLEQTLKMAKPMPVTKNKLKEVHMSLTFMREPNAVPRYGKNDYGFVAVLGEKNFVTVFERTSDDGRFPGIQILTNDGKVVPLEQAEFNRKVAEVEQPKSEQPQALRPEPVKEVAPESVKEESPKLEPVKEVAPESVKEESPKPEPVKEVAPESVKEESPKPEPVKEVAPESVKEESPKLNP